tara:strand:+ start:5042 stop:7273 length:2232 start_codon:yes stop_codon:yes gene_type:complete
MTTNQKLPDLLWTYTDEAPALATHSLLPMVRQVLAQAHLQIEEVDISLAGRLIAAFADDLASDKKQDDDLAKLGNLVKDPLANIIKLPNISASQAQLKAAIAELQSHGYALPDYPESPQNTVEQNIKNRFDAVKGSAVNPVLREGNSDRRVAASVKRYAKSHPHHMGAWQKTSKTHVASMQHGDFYETEQSHTCTELTELSVVLRHKAGQEHTLLSGLKLEQGDIVDAALMRKSALRSYLVEEINKAQDTSLMLSLHLKATMMKVSDPIIFGHAVELFFAPIFEGFAEEFADLGVHPSYGMADLFEKIKVLPEAKQQEITDAYQKLLKERPLLAMVNSDQGITNLHRSNDVIIDASMPAMIRESGCMWNAQGQLEDTKALIPDRSYAGVYQAVIDFCKQEGAFDPKTMGNVANVGLMAQKAQEYGSHNKTFEIEQEGVVQVVNQEGQIVFEHSVNEGDIWRMCMVKSQAIDNWIDLALSRARLSQKPAIFWLDSERAHDTQLIKKVNLALQEKDTSNLSLSIESPIEATYTTLRRLQQGQDTIAITGNVLRDYLTDLFPILELGTSAKMLSIVPLMSGGGLFETGAGGSAPKHVQQFVDEGYLRWDSLGEFLALMASLSHLAEQRGNSQAQILSYTLDQAISKFLEQDKSPKRRLGSIDNRGSHFYLIWYWIQALNTQAEDAELAQSFTLLSESLAQHATQIEQELIAAQGQKQDLGGYYHMDKRKLQKAMFPSDTLQKLFFV